MKARTRASNKIPRKVDGRDKLLKNYKLRITTWNYHHSVGDCAQLSDALMMIRTRRQKCWFVVYLLHTATLKNMNLDQNLWLARNFATIMLMHQWKKRNYRAISVWNLMFESNVHFSLISVEISLAIHVTNNFAVAVGERQPCCDLNITTQLFIFLTYRLVFLSLLALEK